MQINVENQPPDYSVSTWPGTISISDMGLSVLIPLKIPIPVSFG